MSVNQGNVVTVIKGGSGVDVTNQFGNRNTKGIEPANRGFRIGALLSAIWGWVAKFREIRN